jgi:plastocyanin
MIRTLLPSIAALLLVVACSGSSTSQGTTAGNSAGAASTTTPVVEANRPAASPIASPSALAAAASSPSPAAAVPSPSAAASGAGAVTVNMTDSFQFQPANITVPRGGTVTWTNTGQSPHTVTDDPSKAASPADSVLPAGAEPWDSGMINAGGTFSHTFDTPGQYTYFCIPHESLGMVARITVTP